MQCYETRPSAGRNCPLSEIQWKLKRQRDEEVLYFNSYVINLDGTCRLNTQQRQVKNCVCVCVCLIIFRSKAAAATVD